MVLLLDIVLQSGALSYAPRCSENPGTAVPDGSFHACRRCGYGVHDITEEGYRMGLTLDETLQAGIAAHQAGRLQEADRRYAALLKTKPDHPYANNNMGVLRASTGRASISSGSATSMP